MATCTVCTSPKKAELDAALIQGVSVRAAAQQYGFSKSAVERHKNSHLKARLTAEHRKAERERPDPAKHAQGVAEGRLTPTADDLLSLSGVMGRLARSLDRLEEAAEAAADTGMYQGLAAVSGQLHRAVDAICKIQGLYSEKASPAPTTSFGVIINLPGSVDPRTGGGCAVIGAVPVSRGADPMSMNIEFDLLPPMPEHVRAVFSNRDLGNEP